MKISKKNLESLIDTVVLPFENFIIEDIKNYPYLANPEVAKIHNMAVARLTIFIYSDINRAYAYIQEGAKAHKEKTIPRDSLKEYYSLYFTLCREWNLSHFEGNEHFEKNLSTIENFVYEIFAKENETKENFFLYGSETLKQDMKRMHYKDEHKLSAQDFFEEGSMDELDVHDILEACETLFDTVRDEHIDHNQEYFEKVAEQFSAYATIMEKNLEFRDLGFSLAKLTNLLYQNIEALTNHSQKKKILITLNSIVEDLVSWTQSILKYKTAIDIHYLDASLLSSIIQFEMIFTPTSNEEDEEELEFF